MPRWRWLDLPEMLLEWLDPSVRPSPPHCPQPPPTQAAQARRKFNVGRHVCLAGLFLYGLVLGANVFEILKEQVVPDRILAGALLIGCTICIGGLLVEAVLIFLGIIAHWPSPSWNASAVAAPPAPPARCHKPPFPDVGAMLDQGADVIKDTLLDFEIGTSETPQQEEIVRIPVEQADHGAWADRYRKMHEHELRSW